jgi:hypothetical protein
VLCEEAIFASEDLRILVFILTDPAGDHPKSISKELKIKDNRSGGK